MGKMTPDEKSLYELLVRMVGEQRGAEIFNVVQSALLANMFNGLLMALVVRAGGRLPVGVEEVEANVGCRLHWEWDEQTQSTTLTILKAGENEDVNSG